MSLAQEYRNQFVWRDWKTAFDALPPLAGKLVLDLGCGVGDQAAELVARGARVIGFDANEALLEEARARKLANAEFHGADLRFLPQLERLADGLWCSFTAAYFPNLGPVLDSWARCLRPDGWIALIEVDDLFAHEPVAARARELLAAYTQEALEQNRYDFRMGRRLEAQLVQAGFRVARRFELADRELACDGPAPPDVLAAWRARLERMQLLVDSCGAEFEPLRADFLACLARPDHRSLCRVVGCVATR